jgi:flagellar protein FlaG
MKTGAITSTSDALYGNVARPVAGDVGTPAAAQVPDLSAVRLVIEEDRESGSFIYKTLDSVTGEVLKQLPRAEVLEMLSAGRYESGDVIKTRA